MSKLVLKKTFIVWLLLGVVFYAGCGKAGYSQRDLNEQAVLGLTWYQTAAEMRALSYQAFNLARLRFHQDLEHQHDKKRAVVVDIDETILDNSPWQAGLIDTDRGYPDGWKDWCRAAEAKPLPGAVEFLNDVVDNGGDVFYISNRSVELKTGTMANLTALGFPQVEEGHMLLKETSSNKEPRRKIVEETHHIVLLMGDNLGDFAEIFTGKSRAERAAAVDRLRNEFGQKFIVLPNPLYGDWEGAIYDYQYNLSPEQKSRARKSSLPPWPPPSPSPSDR
jgi:5'-nucleotidase (lipoprotein e(P4) family)